MRSEGARRQLYAIKCARQCRPAVRPAGFEPATRGVVPTSGITAGQGHRGICLPGPTSEDVSRLFLRSSPGLLVKARHKRVTSSPTAERRRASHDLWLASPTTKTTSSGSKQTKKSNNSRQPSKATAPLAMPPVHQLITTTIGRWGSPIAEFAAEPNIRSHPPGRRPPATRHFRSGQGESPRRVRRLQCSGRLESWQEIRRRDIRRNCGSGRCGWSRRSAASRSRTGRR